MKKYIKSIFQILATLIICLIFMEITLNQTEIILPTFVITDPKEGDILEPNAEIAYFAEGFALRKVNSAGYWGPVYSIKRNPNTIRIALIGDSYVEALQVQREFHFMTILEKELSKLSGKTVEVLNFGRSGLSFRQMFRTYEFQVKKYQPDFTLFFVQDQDFMRKGPDGGPQVILNDKNELEFTDFEESNIYKSREKWEAVKKYSSYSLIRNVVKMVQSGQSDEILLDKFDFITTAEETMQNKDSLMYKREDPFFELNTAIYKKLKADEQRSKTKNLTVAIESMPKNYSQLIKTFSYLIDLQPPLENFKNETGIDPIYWEVTHTRGHWNYDGHEFVGKYLAKTLKELVSNERAENYSIISN